MEGDYQQSLSGSKVMMETMEGSSASVASIPLSQLSTNRNELYCQEILYVVRRMSTA
jgi:hypothetical protein